MGRHKAEEKNGVLRFEPAATVTATRKLMDELHEIDPLGVNPLSLENRVRRLEIIEELSRLRAKTP